MSSNSISKLEQISILMKLVSKFCDNANMLDCIRLAKDLAGVIDELNFYNVDLSKLAEEFLNLFPEHWKKRTTFLSIVTKYWPQILNDLEKGDTATIVNNKHDDYFVPLSLKQFLQNKKLVISESESIYSEIQSVIEIVTQNPEKKISILSPNELFSTYLIEEFKLRNISYTSYVSNDDFSEEFLSNVEIYFRDVLNDIPRNKLLKELSKFSETPKEEHNIKIYGVNNYVPRGDLLICSELNDLYWRYREKGIFWLHPIIRKTFKMDSDDQRIETIFYKAMSNHRDIYLLRSKSSNGQHMEKSYLLSILEANCKKQNVSVENLKSREQTHEIKTQISEKIEKNAFHMPLELSIRDLEILIKDPHAFFAKKILNLHNKSVIEDKKELLMMIKRLMFCDFKEESDANMLLHSIKDRDFFAYRKCLNILNYAKKLPESGIGQGNYSGQINIPELNLNLYGYCDRIIEHNGYATLISYKTSTPKSTKEILFGDEISTLATCLIAEKGGFKHVKSPIRSIQFWNLLASGNEPIGVKELEISSDVISNFEKRLISRVQEILNCDEINIQTNKKKVYQDYKHFERI